MFHELIFSFMIIGLVLCKEESETTATGYETTTVEQPYMAKDNMGWTDKQKLLTLSLELLKDAKLKLRQVTGLKDEHSEQNSFEVGVLIGEIREKYKRMLETYRDARDRFMNFTQLQGPYVLSYKPVHYIIAMELVHSKEVEIDKLVHILETIPASMLDRRAEQDSDGMKSQMPRFRAKFNDSKFQKLMEQELKSEYHKEYVKRHLSSGMHASEVLSGPNSVWGY